MQNPLFLSSRVRHFLYCTMLCFVHQSQTVPGKVEGLCDWENVDELQVLLPRCLPLRLNNSPPRQIIGLINWRPSRMNIHGLYIYIFFIIIISDYCEVKERRNSGRGWSGWYHSGIWILNASSPLTTRHILRDELQEGINRYPTRPFVKSEPNNLLFIFVYFSYHQGWCDDTFQQNSTEIIPRKHSSRLAVPLRTVYRPNILGNLNSDWLAANEGIDSYWR